MFDKITDIFRKSDENTRNIIKNAAGAFIVKGGALVVTLLATPAYIKYFGNDDVLGVWFTFLSVLTWILNFDLGIGNGLRNRLTDSFAKNDAALSHKYISNAYISTGALVFCLLLAFYTLFGFVDWGWLINAPAGSISEGAFLLSLKIVFTGVLLQFFLKTVSSVLYAMQLSAVNNLLSLVTSLINLLFVLLSNPGTNDRNLIAISLVNVIAVNIPLLAVTVIVFSTKLKAMAPSLGKFNFKTAFSLAKLGLFFFVVQVEYMLIVNTNEFIITLFTDSANVVEYQIYYRMFTLIGTVAFLALTPVWSAITKADAEKKFGWIKELYKKLLFIGALACLAEFLLVVFVQFGFDIWLGSETITVNYFYALLFAAFGSLIILNGIFSSFANGTGRLKTQIICFGIGSLLKIPLSYLFITLLGSWIGAILSNVAVLSVYIIAQPIVLNSHFNRLSRETGLPARKKRRLRKSPGTIN